MQITSTRAALSLDGPCRLVAAAGTEVAVVRRGEGVALLCLHAVGHGSGDFALLADRLLPAAAAGGPSVEIVAVDWPGHGRSPPDRTGAAASAERYAEILAALIPKLSGGAAPMLLGNSIGGAAAIHVAAGRTAPVRGLVLCNPGGLAPVDATARHVCAAMAGFFRWGAAGAAFYPPLFRAYYRQVLPLAPARRAEIAAAAVEMAPLLAEAWASFAHVSSDLRALLPRISAPVFAGWAAGDRIVSWGRSRAAVAASGAQVQLFRGGHAPFLEDADAFADALGGVLADWLGGGGRLPEALGAGHASPP